MLSLPRGSFKATHLHSWGFMSLLRGFPTQHSANANHAQQVGTSYQSTSSPPEFLQDTILLLDTS